MEEALTLLPVAPALHRSVTSFMLPAFPYTIPKENTKSTTVCAILMKV